jgi:hypothetical protein
MAYLQFLAGTSCTHQICGSTRSARDVINSKRDAFVFRLSEMYLIAAEASMKLGDNAKAANYVNVVRSRAALPGKQPLCKSKQVI